MKTSLLATLFCLLFSNPTIFDFKLPSIDEGKEIDLSAFKGKKILIVNTASKSPYTFQLEGLQQLYSAYKEKLVVIAVPAGDDFGEQELESNKEIRNFLRSSYGITFPIAEKTTTMGSMQHPLFAFLIDEAKKLGEQEPVIKWNFTKFLLDENRQLMKVFPADVTPLSTEITSYLNNSRNWSLY